MAYEDVICILQNHQEFKPVTYINDQYLGYRNEFEIAELEEEARDATRQVVRDIPIEDRADIYIYAMYKRNLLGEITYAGFYSNYAVSLDRYRSIKANLGLQIRCLCYRYSKSGIDLAR